MRFEPPVLAPFRLLMGTVGAGALAAFEVLMVRAKVLSWSITRGEWTSSEKYCWFATVPFYRFIRKTFMWGNIFLKPRNKFLDDGMGGKWKCNRRFYTVFSERKWMGCAEECDGSISGGVRSFRVGRVWGRLRTMTAMFNGAPYWKTQRLWLDSGYINSWLQFHWVSYIIQVDAIRAEWLCK